MVPELGTTRGRSKEKAPILAGTRSGLFGRIAPGEKVLSIRASGDGGTGSTLVGIGKGKSFYAINFNTSRATFPGLS